MEKMVGLLEKFIEDDRAKTESIANLSKAVLDLAEEVKELKSSKKVIRILELHA